MVQQISYADYPILFVDNNKENLLAYPKKLGSIFSIFIADSTDEAFSILNQTPHIAVVVSERNISQVTGIEFLNEVRALYPDIIRIILTAESDFKAAFEMINRKEIYKFLFKPCKYEMLKVDLMRAIEQFLLQVEQKLFLEERFELEKLSTIGELAEGFAHEIRNPITVIGLNTEFILSRLLNRQVQIEKMENTLNEILSQCQRLSKAIEGIVEFARPNKVNYKYFKLNSLISRSIFLIRREMDFDGIEIMNEIPINLPRIYGNRIQLEQVFIHLFRLSHHTLQGRGTILIKGKIEPKERAIAIDYIDNRLSISSEDFKRILSHFFAHKQDHMSTGLYVIHKIIQSLGGKMIIDRDKDGRNIIRIHLFYKN